MVHRSTDDNHRLALGLFGVIGKFARHMGNLVGRHTGDLFRPGGCAGHVVGIIGRDPFTTQTTVKPVVGAEEVKNRRNGDFAIGCLDPLDGDVARQNIGVNGISFELAIGFAAEVGKINADHGVMVFFQNEGRLEPGVSLV